MVASTDGLQCGKRLPRDPEEYRPADPDVVLAAKEHDVPGEAIESAIRRGYIKPAGRQGRYRFAIELGGFLYRIVVERQPDQKKHDLIEVCEPRYLGVLDQGGQR
jgi:hypothetical protein